MTNREHALIVAWLKREWNEPSRSDWYLMQIACEVRRVLSNNPNSIQPKQFKMPFEFKPPKEQAKVDSKSTWLAALGIKPRRK